jgi:hypothetical protein
MKTKIINKLNAVTPASQILLTIALFFFDCECSLIFTIVFLLLYYAANILLLHKFISSKPKNIALHRLKIILLTFSYIFLAFNENSLLALPLIAETVFLYKYKRNMFARVFLTIVSVVFIIFDGIEFICLAETGIILSDIVTSYSIIEARPADLSNVSYIIKRFDVIPFDYVDKKYVRFDVIHEHLIADWYWGTVGVSWME